VDLPVEQTTKMHLYINRRNALELASTSRLLLLSRAEEMIARQVCFGSLAT